MPFKVHLFRPESGVVVEVERLAIEGGEKPGVGRAFGELKRASRRAGAVHGFRASRLAPGKRQQAARSPRGSSIFNPRSAISDPAELLLSVPRALEAEKRE